MKILNSQVYVGPNIYALFPVIRLTLDLGALEEWPTERLGAASSTRCSRPCPGLHQHGCSYGEPGGFVRRLHEGEGTWLGHVLEHVAIELQNVAGTPVTFGKTRGTRRARRSTSSSTSTSSPTSAWRRASWRCSCCTPCCRRSCARPTSTPSISTSQRRRDRFIRFAQSKALGPSTASLVAAAEKRDIPWLRLNDQSLIQFGHGRFQQRIQATITSSTPHIAVELASDKEETVRLLGDLGLPVPKQRMVYDAEEAASAARRIGFPVVVKPLNANHGRGVSIRLMDEEQVKARVRHRPRAQPRRPGRELPRGPRPPPAGGQRRADRRLQAHARPRRRRRRAHGRASWSRS